MKCKLLFSNRFEKPKVRWQKIKNITANSFIYVIQNIEPVRENIKKHLLRR